MANNWELDFSVQVGEYLSTEYKWQHSLDSGDNWMECLTGIVISGVAYRRRAINSYEKGSYKEFFYVNDDTIHGFFEDHRYLSNFHTCEFTYMGKHWKSSEHAYMWSKCKHDESEEAYELIKDMTAGQVKRWGRDMEVSGHIRDNWTDIKQESMLEILTCKFGQNPELKQALLDTNNKTIIEANNWNDKFWGYCVKTKCGSNRLGKILMGLRSHFAFEEVLSS